MAATLAVVPKVVSQPALLDPFGSVAMTDTPITSFDPIEYGTPIALNLISSLGGATMLASAASTYSDGNFSFVLTSSVFTGVDQGLVGGFGSDKLVFAYKITDVLAPDPVSIPSGVRKWGITSFGITGFGGFGVAVAQLDEVGVNGGNTTRSGDGDLITFNYPPVNPAEGQAPPIYEGENSRTLYVFTTATASSINVGEVVSTEVDYAGHPVLEVPYGQPVLRSVSAYAPSSVPDSASTSGLIGLALVLLAAGFRMRASSRG